VSKLLTPKVAIPIGNAVVVIWRVNNSIGGVQRNIARIFAMFAAGATAATPTVSTSGA
jgi:hypothetical protein